MALKLACKVQNYAWGKRGEASAVAQLARASGCLVLVWVTNSRHVQDFVEKVRVRARARARLGLGLGLELPEP